MCFSAPSCLLLIPFHLCPASLDPHWGAGGKLRAGCRGTASELSRIASFSFSVWHIYLKSPWTLGSSTSLCSSFIPSLVYAQAQILVCMIWCHGALVRCEPWWMHFRLRGGRGKEWNGRSGVTWTLRSGGARGLACHAVLSSRCSFMSEHLSPNRGPEGQRWLSLHNP